MAVMDAANLQQQSQPILALMSAPVPHRMKRAVDLVSRICQVFPNTYKESPSKAMSARTICLMRVDNQCPKCHGFEHVDVDKNGTVLCTKPVSSDWLMGPYSGRKNKYQRVMPTKGAFEVANMLKL